MTDVPDALVERGAQAVGDVSWIDPDGDHAHHIAAAVLAAVWADLPAARPVVDAPEPTEREVKELAYRLGGELPSSIDGPTLRRTAEALLIHYGYVSPRRHEHTLVQDAADVRRAVAAEAWDEGYARGVRDEIGEMEHADNPYREVGEGQ